MKIKMQYLPYEKVMEKSAPKHKKPLKPSLFWRSLIRLISIPDLIKVKFNSIGSFDKKGGPYFILMNHSCFLDLEIAHKVLFPLPFSIVCTSDGFVGKQWLMRQIGCIPTKKFVTDLGLMSDIKYMLKEKKTSVLMFPEASYSFDGTATPLPRRLGILLKKLDVPVLYIETIGAFSHNPLYNCLKRRKVGVSANTRLLLSREDLKKKTVDEIDEILDSAFSFDHFSWQQQNKINISEDFRAEGLERILYRCPNCQSEGNMKGHGISIKCHSCEKEYILDEYGFLKATSGDTEFPHIPDWYAWERECVRDEILKGEYELSADVEIAMMMDYKAIYNIGRGHLSHSDCGFNLKSDDGKLSYNQSPTSSYGLYADYYWYEIGDVISIGDKQALYYCFTPKGVSVAKARLAAEEIYKIKKEKKKKNL